VGRLGGFRYRDVAKRLRELGFEPKRQAAGSHEVWMLPGTTRIATVSKHTGDIPEGTLRSILRQAEIPVEDFLALKPRPDEIQDGVAAYSVGRVFALLRGGSLAHP
jgi:predicted RNA binding protein YcfA (HicA-like mRNA interferase family)